jgi:DNA-directed RNA polymerase subunit H
MDIIKKIELSRKTLKEILSDEYNTETLSVLSSSEIDTLYRINEPSSKYSILSNCEGCCFTLEHKEIKGHHIHIIYYNFPSIGDNKSTKINKKSFIDRIKKIYETKMIQQTDSIIIILNDSISESIVQINNTINIILQEEEINMDHLNTKLKQNHFRNIYIFDIKSLLFNILNHEFVPRHDIIRDIDKIKEIYEENNCNDNTLPIILRNDPVAKLKLCVPGDIVKITRTSKTTGKYTYYRICK